MLGLLFGGLALFAAVAALSEQDDRAFTPAMVYLGLGAVLSLGLGLFGVELLSPIDDAEVIERLAELAVIIALFSAGLRLDRELRLRRWASPLLLLALVMPATIAAVAALGAGLMGLSVGAAIILAAALAPTDPVLAGDLQVGPPGSEDEPEPRFALTAEAGLNDGLAFPFVLLGVFVAEQGGTDWLGEWLATDVLYAVVVGLVIGALAGHLLGRLVPELHRRDLLAPRLEGFVAVASVLVIYAVTELAGAYGFLAAFAGGVAFRRYEHEHELHGPIHEGAEVVEKVTELAMVLLLGSTVTIAGLGEPGVGGWILALLLLFAIRPLLTVVSLAVTRMPLTERGFIGWFGIRGIGSFYYAAVALGTGVLSADEAGTVYWTIVVCAGLSIVLHGITASPFARRLGL
jgi:sodium/hydrogen antiporter